MQAVESLKFCTLMGSFCPNHIKIQLKKYWRVSFMTMKSDSKYKEKLNCDFKSDMRNLMNFHPTTQKSENFFLIGSFCPKYTRFEGQKYRRVISHDTEQWCETWINHDLVVSKMTWGIGWTFVRGLKNMKNCTLMASFCPKHIMLRLENYIGIMYHDTEQWCKNWRKTDSWLEKWHDAEEWCKILRKVLWGIWWILMRVVTSLKIFTLMCYFCRKYITFVPKIYRGVMCHNTEEWYKIWAKSIMRNLTNFDPTLEILKLCTLMGSFWPKYIMFELKKYRVVRHYTED